MALHRSFTQSIYRPTNFKGHKEVNLDLKTAKANISNTDGAWQVQNLIFASLQFRDRNNKKPVVYTGKPELGEGFETKTVPIADGRSILDLTSLDDEGFELWPHNTEVFDFYDDEKIRKRYYPEVAQLVKVATGASRVIIFDHTVRIEDEAQRDERAVRAPVNIVHNDYTERSGPRRVRDLLDADDAETFLSHRFAIVNVWRSIGTPIETTPIAIVDAQSIAPDDFVATDFVRPDRIGELYQVAYSPDHRWVYFPRMHRDEALLIKCYDSATDGRARFTAHSAFDNPAAPANAAPRESIEVRTLVSYAP